MSRYPETVSLVLDIVSDVSRGEGERREGVGVLAQLSSSNNNLNITSGLFIDKLDTLFPAIQRESVQVLTPSGAQVCLCGTSLSKSLIFCEEV